MVIRVEKDSRKKRKSKVCTNNTERAIKIKCLSLSSVRNVLLKEGKGTGELYLTSDMFFGRLVFVLQ